jgi:hydroxyacylglutathione hydrolase
MYMKLLYDTKLAQASYLVGCQATGDAIVIDPSRNVDQYIALAAAEGLRIAFVTETHIHADFVSGSREVAHRTGAHMLLSDEGGAGWQYTFAAADDALLLRDGDVFHVGKLRFDVLHTPGHTPEHLSFMVTDTPAGAGAMGVLTGDFVFVGDVGRPDLLEKSAKVAGSMDASARTLFRSLQRFAALPDHLQIWPGHGAGSACGKALGAVSSTTLGYERKANWAFQIHDEAEFVAAVLDGQPEPPTYFAEMKRINRDGPPLLHGTPRATRMASGAILEALAAGALVIDTRSAATFADAHVPGTINIPLNKSFTTWAGWLVPFDRDFYLLIDTDEAKAADDVVRDLAMIGLDRVAGVGDESVRDSWVSAGHTLAGTPQINVTELARRMASQSLAVVDVRGHAEWESGHLSGVSNIPVGYLTDNLAALPRNAPIAVHCQSGARSAIAASVLRANGFADVMNVTGGFLAWQAAGLPVERDRRTAGAA